MLCLWLMTNTLSKVDLLLFWVRVEFIMAARGGGSIHTEAAQSPLIIQ